MSTSVLVINLPRDRDRLLHIEATFGARSIGYERLEAVDGRQLSTDDLARWSSPQEWHLPLTPSEVACGLSHRKAWGEIVSRDLAHAVIFEDDVLLSRNAGEMLRDLSWIPDEADLVRIETLLKKVTIDKSPRHRFNGHALRTFHSMQCGSGGYILSRAGAEKLLRLTANSLPPVDHFLFNPRFAGFRELVIYQLDPAICVQDSILNKSEATLKGRIDHFSSRAKRSRTLVRVGRELARAYARTRDNVGALWGTKRRRVIGISV